MKRIQLIVGVGVLLAAGLVQAADKGKGWTPTWIYTAGANNGEPSTNLTTSSYEQIRTSVDNMQVDGKGGGAFRVTQTFKHWESRPDGTTSNVVWRSRDSYPSAKTIVWLDSKGKVIDSIDADPTYLTNIRLIGVTPLSLIYAVVSNYPPVEIWGHYDSNGTFSPTPPYTDSKTGQSPPNQWTVFSLDNKGNTTTLDIPVRDWQTGPCLFDPKGFFTVRADESNNTVVTPRISVK